MFKESRRRSEKGGVCSHIDSDSPLSSTSSPAFPLSDSASPPSSSSSPPPPLTLDLLANKSTSNVRSPHGACAPAQVQPAANCVVPLLCFESPVVAPSSPPCPSTFSSSPSPSPALSGAAPVSLFSPPLSLSEPVSRASFSVPVQATGVQGTGTGTDVRAVVGVRTTPIRRVKRLSEPVLIIRKQQQQQQLTPVSGRLGVSRDVRTCEKPGLFLPKTPELDASNPFSDDFLSSPLSLKTESESEQKDKEKEKRGRKRE